jgi:hypothetical protein
MDVHKFRGCTTGKFNQGFVYTKNRMIFFFAKADTVKKIAKYLVKYAYSVQAWVNVGLNSQHYKLTFAEGEGHLLAKRSFIGIRW